MNEILICGIDEAGRGALIGPMVIAGVVIDQKDEKELKSIGVRDSKTLKPKQREHLASEIEKIAKNIVLMRVPACKIYTYRKTYKIKLDSLEAMKISQIIDLCSADRFYIDSLGNTNSNTIIPGKFETSIRQNLGNRQIDIVAENYADETYPVVSAASIMAKVDRDKEIEELKRRVDFDFGVGYSHDNRTIKFLEKILKESKEPPSFVRWHWGTVEDTAERLIQQGLKLQPWVSEEILNQDSWQKRIKDFFKKREKCKEAENES